MRVVTIALAAMLAAPTMAVAQVSEAEKCAVMEDNDARLARYDAAFATEPTPAVAGPTGEAETFEALQSRLVDLGWLLDRGVSAMDDTQSVFLSGRSTNQLRMQYGKPTHATFTVRCRENTTSAFFIFGGKYLSDHYGGEITYRVDDRKAQMRNFTESSDNEALGLWNGRRSIPLIKEIMEGKELLVRTTPVNESPVEARFDLTLFKAGLTFIREACNW